MLFLNDEIRTDSEGFMYLFRVELLLGLPRKAPLRVNLDQDIRSISLSGGSEDSAACAPGTGSRLSP